MIEVVKHNQEESVAITAFEFLPTQDTATIDLVIKSVTDKDDASAIDTNGGIPGDGTGALILTPERPTATATFGIFRGSDRIIYWREVAN